MPLRKALPTLIGIAALIAAGSATAVAANSDKLVVLASYTMGDRAVDPMSESIRAILINVGGQGDFLAKKDIGALTAFYRGQGFEPSWIMNGKLTDRALALVARIKQADADGLDPAAYPVPDVKIGVDTPAKPQDLAHAEVMLSQAIMDYVHDAHSGRLDPADISQNLDYKPHVTDPVAALNKISMADDAPQVMASYNPQHPEFWALRQQLAEARAAEKALPPVVPGGRNLKLGVKDPRVVILRERLKIAPPAPETPVAAAGDTTAAGDKAVVTPVSATADQTGSVQPKATPAVDKTVVDPAPAPAAAPPAKPFDPEVFDESVDAAVKAFQESAGLKPDGIVGPATLGRLNAAAESHVDTILVNMERWRWMPEHLGNFYVRVNIPNFNLNIYKDGKPIYTTRIVDGQPTKQTPIFDNAIQYVIVNPVWNIPESIAVKEMLPEIRANPAKALNGYQVFALIDGRFRPVDPWSVDWNTVDMRRIQIKQPPGERNALGSIKFMFPNPYAVYLHDTPSKSLFQRDYRALSHGCMRVMDPWEFATVLLDHDPNVSAAGLRKLLGGPQTQVNLTKPIPVHITYFTAWVDDAGKLQLRPDIYRHDAQMEKALGLVS